MVVTIISISKLSITSQCSVTLPTLSTLCRVIVSIDAEIVIRNSIAIKLDFVIMILTHRIKDLFMVGSIATQLVQKKHLMSVMLP